MPLTLYAPSSIFANETIATQTDTFGARLESIFTMIAEGFESHALKKASDLVDDPRLKQLEKLVYDRLKLKIRLIPNEPMAAAVLPFYSSKNHIFLPEFVRGNLNIREQDKLLRQFDQRQGSVNLEKATVAGIFSEYEHPLYLNLEVLIKHLNLTAGEVTAVLLHELGHAFYACYYADRTDTTNQVLASIARRLIKHNEQGDVDYVYAELTKINDEVTKDQVDKMLNGPRIIAGATWFKTIVGTVRSQMLNDTYTESAFEQRADNFAARFGYGKQLVLGLDKLSAVDPGKSRSLRIFLNMSYLVSVVALASLIFGLLATGSVFLGLLFVAYKYLFLSIYREDAQDHTYDGLKQRYLRVRQDAIDQLKQMTLDKDKTREILAAIATIDAVIKDTSIFKSIGTTVANFLFSGSRKASQSIEDQQLLEAMASNDLFIQSAELRVR